MWGEMGHLIIDEGHGVEGYGQSFALRLHDAARLMRKHCRRHCVRLSAAAAAAAAATELKGGPRSPTNIKDTKIVFFILRFTGAFEKFKFKIENSLHSKSHCRTEFWYIKLKAAVTIL